MRIGVLALQGGFKEHIDAIKKLGHDAVEIKLPLQVDSVDGLIIPGGESTTLTQLMEKYSFNIKELEIPIFGTCAGCIILTKLGMINIKIDRNAYGSQLNSFEDDIKLNKEEKNDRFHGVFIRAPKIVSFNRKVEVLGMHDGFAVLVKQDNVMAATFHPELTDDTRVHKMFLDMVESRKENMK